MNNKQAKSKQLHISISEADLAKIDSNARYAAMNRSEYIRSSALNCPIDIPPIPTEALRLLCSISTILTQNTKLDTKQTQQIRTEVDSLWQLLN